jgi:hypothetical protein
MTMVTILIGPDTMTSSDRGRKRGSDLTSGVVMAAHRNDSGSNQADCTHPYRNPNDGLLVHTNRSLHLVSPFAVPSFAVPSCEQRIRRDIEYPDLSRYSLVDQGKKRVAIQ